MLNCREVTRLLSEAQERQLSVVERMNLRVHTLICVGCRHFDENITSLRAISRAYMRENSTRNDPPNHDDSRADPS